MYTSDYSQLQVSYLNDYFKYKLCSAYWKVTLLALDDTALGKEEDETGIEGGDNQQQEAKLPDLATVTITEVKEDEGGTVEGKEQEGVYE